jgi:hypothetical protein
MAIKALYGLLHVSIKLIIIIIINFIRSVGKSFSLKNTD